MVFIPVYPYIPTNQLIKCDEARPVCFVSLPVYDLLIVIVLRKMCES